MAASGGIILSTLRSVHRFGVSSGVFPGVLSQVRQYAARKGTREKMRKKKVKKEVKKLTFEEKIKKSKKVAIVKPDAIRYQQNSKGIAQDDVYFQKLFQWKIYPFAEAIQCHREHFHPTMFNMPDAIVQIYAELNMQGLKKTKPVETFRKMVSVKHEFDHGEERKVLVFCSKESEVKEVLDAGAALAGGADIVKLIVSGEISLQNYDTVIAHPTVMPDILTIRGLLKKKYPNIKQGTMGVDLKQMLKTQLHGIKYTATPYAHFPEFGSTTIPIGKLNMEIEQLEDNLKEAVNSIMSAKPKRPGDFITRIRVICPPSTEKFKIDLKLYVPEEEGTDESKQGDDDEEGEEDQAAISVAL